MAPLIRQVYDAEKDICERRAKETFGEAWRQSLTNPQSSTAGANIKTELVTLVKDSLNLIDINTKQQAPIVFVFAVALRPKNDMVVGLVDYLEEQETIKANANGRVSVPLLQVIFNFVEEGKIMDSCLINKHVNNRNIVCASLCCLLRCRIRTSHLEQLLES